MDTYGFHEFDKSGNVLDIFDGFFIADVDENGVDVPEVRLGGSLTAGAKLELLIASAGVRGGVFANVNFNLHDIPDPETGLTDGKIRAGEIARNLQLGPIHVFDVSGQVDAGLDAFVDVNLLFFQIHANYRDCSHQAVGFRHRSSAAAARSQCFRPTGPGDEVRQHADPEPYFRR